MHDKAGTFFCGTSNVELPVANKTQFPPEFQDKSRLNYYASIFNSVEINSSFYKVPLPRTVEKWAGDVPDDFRFTFKLWREITHAKELNYDVANIEKVFLSINKIGNKKGCLLIQFPASIKVSYFQKIKRLLSDLTPTGMSEGWKIAVEFRDKSWYQDKVYQMLEQYNASVVVHDMPKSYTPIIDMEQSFLFLRFHGERGDYRGGYEDEVLQEHASVISQYMDEGLHVYTYFNNTIGDAVQNAMTLAGYVKDMR